MIRLEGYTVREASNLKAGYKRLEKEDIDLILCDVKLLIVMDWNFISQVKPKYPF